MRNCVRGPFIPTKSWKEYTPHPGRVLRAPLGKGGKEGEEGKNGEERGRVREGKEMERREGK